MSHVNYMTEVVHNRKPKILQDAEDMQEVTRDMLLLSTGSVRQRRHCLSVKSSIVTLTQNDSVDLAQTRRLTLLSPMCTNALQSYVNGCSICQKKKKSV